MVVAEVGVEQPPVPVIPEARPLVQEQATTEEMVRQAVGQPRVPGVAGAAGWATPVVHPMAVVEDLAYLPWGARLQP